MTSARLAWSSLVVAAGIQALCGCATTMREEKLRARVQAAGAGFSWSEDPGTGVVVTVEDLDGSRCQFVWKPADVGAQPPEAFRACTERLKWALRFPDTAHGVSSIRSGISDCIDSSGMKGHEEVALPAAKEYVVELSAGDSSGRMSRAGVPIWSSGSPYLGARRRIRSESSSGGTAVADAAACAEVASREDIFTSRSLTTGKQDGWGTTVGSVTISPAVGRFDACMISRGYVVEAAPESRSSALGAGWDPRYTDQHGLDRLPSLNPVGVSPGSTR
jgi:hypothetical protein